MVVPKNHPRYESLLLREKVKDCLKEGIISEVGIAAHGRGEAFDYFLGERTTEQAETAIKASARLLCRAENPVISVNGNIACLVPEEIVKISKILPLKIEINLFYRTVERETKIKKRLEKFGGKNILGVGENANECIPGLDSLRGKVSREGIFTSDVIIVPLEDGDRALALKNMGKKIIAIDLNPLSRTSLCADITIVDNVVRAMPRLIEEIKKLKNKDIEEEFIFDNAENIKKSIEIMKNNLIRLQEKIDER
ncbi:MAG: 4-phosphopantoate--beta-alanine ligase [Candidatus Methanofastidiosum methylothiophilum]|uniref:4-phosphopantoate--beta-alanine ligase n=1 Tax=Candidatus Methanofastidiosum methylothiophilum TaxID=1705564 RepID=A0A150IML0_9EURY|nr:MAG: 4-phosphopantoate--beta-alanine ligase [Candidatus Methanofastidiosum methylthiophilus]KYC48437.1 MAG: 4-phosphopantoate--beta-alanine ligase [Candidatus Methanofastidiosum methylthiophilus]KYC51051.1 MAG: 4-phosphopantoate--beta-alanine ligase [Candidatus Methanofastidiosum methylthiophilus]